jgi:hypothetical protein
MTNTAAQQVQIYAFDESLVVTTRFQLLQWKHALNLEINHGLKHSQGSLVSHLRKVLKVPARYPSENIKAHIEASIRDIDEQFKTGEFNLEARA